MADAAETPAKATGKKKLGKKERMKLRARELVESGAMTEDEARARRTQSTAQSGGA